MAIVQETKLARQTEMSKSGKQMHIQTSKQIERFISHYERLTRHALDVLPEDASWVIELDKEHNMKSLIRHEKLVRLE